MLYVICKNKVCAMHYLSMYSETVFGMVNTCTNNVYAHNN